MPCATPLFPVPLMSVPSVCTQSEDILAFNTDIHLPLSMLQIMKENSEVQFSFLLKKKRKRKKNLHQNNIVKTMFRHDLDLSFNQITKQHEIVRLPEHI